ncbi:MAG: Maf family protein [Myxococcota bacterium]|nr:Maf family protein [Myxococcota bacterium]
MSLILASGSPRRRMLLTTCGIPLTVSPADIPEIRQPGEPPVDFARRLAGEKASAVGGSAAWVLAADTVVHTETDIFGKPADDADAARILRALSGRWHSVTTGWCLRQGRQQALHHATTRVRFRTLSEVEIAGYIATGEGRDKAGSYGIQGIGAVLVAELEGSYTNVVGLPLEAVLSALAAHGIIGVTT